MRVALAEAVGATEETTVALVGAEVVGATVVEAAGTDEVEDTLNSTLEVSAAMLELAAEITDSTLELAAAISEDTAADTEANEEVKAADTELATLRTDERDDTLRTLLLLLAADADETELSLLLLLDDVVVV